MNYEREELPTDKAIIRIEPARDYESIKKQQLIDAILNRGDADRKENEEWAAADRDVWTRATR